MIRFMAIIENTLREGMAKKMILTLILLITVIIGFFLLAMGVAGSILFVFGQRITTAPDIWVRRFEAGVTAFFYQFALFLGTFAIAAFYPDMQEKGTVDLLLSRPMSRFNIYMAKFIGCLMVVLVVISYLTFGLWAVIWMKTGIAHIEFLYTIPIFMLIFTAFMSFAALTGILTRNSTVSAILTIFFPFIFSAIFFGLHQSEVMFGDPFWYPIFEGLYWVFPKTPELMAWNIQLIARGESDVTLVMTSVVIWSTLAFSAVCYLIGYFVFQKRSY